MIHLTITVTFHNFAAAHRLSGTIAELHIDQATNQMVPEGDNLSHVRSPGRVQAEAAEVWFTDTTSKKVFTQPINCLIYLLATNKIPQHSWNINACLSCSIKNVQFNILQTTSVLFHEATC